MPKIALYVRRLRPVVSLLLLQAWAILRCTPSQPRQSLLEIGIAAIQATREQLLTTLAVSRVPIVSRWTAPLVLYVWRLVEDAIAILVLVQLCRFIYILYHYSLTEWMDLFVSNIFEWAKTNVPGVQAELDRQVNTFSSTTDAILNKDPNRTLTLVLPREARSASTIVKELESCVIKEDQKWKDGRVSGMVYPNDSEHTELMSQVYRLYAWSNPLHPGYWPKMNQCEGEVISMTANLLHGPSIGCITSGGTESIILAIRAHLNYYGRRRGIQHPEIICGTSAHAAVNKACDMFGIRQVSIDVNDGIFLLQPELVRSKISSNTILIYSSAPTYAQGVVDPIPELSRIAVQYDIGLHVDACLGGFVLPFCEDPPMFDFRNPGVTSMSADTHKYGFAVKGTSVVVYRDKSLRHGQYFSYPHWTGGMYATPTIAGSRPGALSVCAWAAMLSIGEDGYRNKVSKIQEAALIIARGIYQTPGLKLLTPRPYMVVCFGSDEVDIYRVQDIMSASGWIIKELQGPASLHVCVTMSMVSKVSFFIRDLRTAVAHVRKEGDAGKSKGTAGIYGAGKFACGWVVDLLKNLNNALDCCS